MVVVVRPAGGCVASKTYADIRPGDKVYFVNSRNQRCSGRVVMLGSNGWVVNIGGQHGTPAIVSESNFLTIGGKNAKTSN